MGNRPPRGPVSFGTPDMGSGLGVKVLPGGGGTNRSHRKGLRREAGSEGSPLRQTPAPRKTLTPSGVAATVVLPDFNGCSARRCYRLTVDSVRTSVPPYYLAAFALVLVLGACDEAPRRPPTNTTAESGISFQVLQRKCGHANVVTADRTIEAEGEFCLVALDVRNEGSVAVTLDPKCQYMLGAWGARFSPDLEVMELDEQAVAGFGEPIDPGQVVANSALYYDVPKGTRPIALELHEVCEDAGISLPLDPELEGADS